MFAICGPRWSFFRKKLPASRRRTDPEMADPEMFITMRYRVIACLSLALVSAACTSTPADKAAKAMRLGKEAVQKKDYSRAAIEFKIAARSLPKDPEPLFQLALVYLEIGDVNTAVQALQVALTIDPQH